MFRKQILFLTAFILMAPLGAKAKEPRLHPMGGGFPAYPKRGPAKGPKEFHPVGGRHDSLGNHVTEDHLSRVEFAHGRTDLMMKKDVHVTEVVKFGRAHFVNVYKHEYEHRFVVVDGFLHHYNTVIVANPRVLELWHRHLFFGGFYYGFHPVLDIDAYFYNPMVYWFYVGSANEYYYRNWYKAEYDAYPQLRKPFEYSGMFYPTENLRQLLFGVSGMTVEKQVQFRDSVSLFTVKLAQNLANVLHAHIQLAKGDVIITHYEILGYDEAVVLEGIVTANGAGQNFKGVLDLQNPAQTTVIAPIALNAEPTTDQIKTIDDLNRRIGEIKGEPVQSPTETSVPAEPATGQITADPEK